MHRSGNEPLQQIIVSVTIAKKDKKVIQYLFLCEHHFQKTLAVTEYI